MNKSDYTFSRFRESVGKFGLKNALYWGIFINFMPASLPYLFRRNKEFTFRGKNYKYFYHKYNFTWENERSVEVPIIYDIIKGSRGKRILEVGCVLRHYYDLDIDVLDKYESCSWAINEDALDFKPDKKYDLIVSISTLEHVGFDEPIKDDSKFLKAINNLKHNLKKGGRLVFTVPLGYNKHVDMLFEKKMMPLSESYFMRRSEQNLEEWKEASYDEIRKYISEKRLFIGKKGDSRLATIAIGVIDHE